MSFYTFLCELVWLRVFTILLRVSVVFFTMSWMLWDNLSDLSKLSKMFNKSGPFEFSERAQAAAWVLECFLFLNINWWQIKHPKERIPCMHCIFSVKQWSLRWCVFLKSCFWIITFLPLAQISFYMASQNVDMWTFIYSHCVDLCMVQSNVHW